MWIEIIASILQPVTLPDNSVCYVEIRDVSLLDAPSVTLRSTKIPATMSPDGRVCTAVIELENSDMLNKSLNVWVHLSQTGEQRIQKGDYLTTAAYPVNLQNKDYSMRVELQRY